MFSQKKRVPWGWIAIVIVLAAFGFLMIFAALTDDSDPQEGENNNMPQQNVQSDQEDDANTDNDGNGEELSAPASKITQESYYLVKNDNNVEVNSGSTYLDNLNNYDVIMKSPGISLKDFELSNIRANIKSQLELLLEFFKVYTIGITGTKGKSTTSSLIYKVLKDQGKDVLLLGNIGTPVFDWIDEIKENMCLVLEMSSHQLEFMDLSPNISLLLNVYEEHLDHYKSLDSYIDAKCNIFSHQKKSDYYIYNADINKIIDKNIKFKTDSTKYAVTLKDNLVKEDNIVTYKNEKIYINDIEVYDTKNNRKLLGMHNLNNIMFVLAISKILNLDSQKTIATINSFEALPHRIEYVGKYNDITFYNDSIATIPEATINSIEALKNVNTLIIGGLDRV